ncbi:MAG: hypothetical protein EXR78_06835 [Deltaproteobacteria bacterium]|nr:hypothetical protein [Deltaproteobacteria bacterium]
MASNQVGNPVVGKDFYGREAFVNLVAEKFKTGHVLLAAPRRFGKTSVMFNLMDKPRWNYRIVHADLEHFTEPSELITHLIEQIARNDVLVKLLKGLTWLPQQLWGFLKRHIDEVGLVGVKIKLKEQLRSCWQERGEELFRTLAQSPETIIFFLDEFPMMIDRMARSSTHREDASTLLRWLRALRQNPETTKVRFLIAGSIGIDRVLNQLGEIKSINDFETLQLEPFSPKIASAFLADLAREHQPPLALSSPCKRKMLTLIGTPVPYFLQILFAEIAKTFVQEGEKLTPAYVERIYRDKVLGSHCKTYFDYYYSRLSDYYDPDTTKAARRILRELAVEGRLTRDACWQFFKTIVGNQADLEDFNRVMTDLENDFYLRFAADARQYQFSCSLLRDWWLRHYGMSSGD